MDGLNGYLTIAEAAALLRRDPATLRQAAGRGSLAVTRVGSFYLVTAAEVERYRRENLNKRGRPKKRPAPEAG